MPIFDQGYQHWSGTLSGHAWRVRSAKLLSSEHRADTVFSRQDRRLSCAATAKSCRRLRLSSSVSSPGGENGFSRSQALPPVRPKYFFSACFESCRSDISDSVYEARTGGRSGVLSAQKDYEMEV